MTDVNTISESINNEINFKNCELKVYGLYFNITKIFSIEGLLKFKNGICDGHLIINNQKLKVIN